MYNVANPSTQQLDVDINALKAAVLDYSESTFIDVEAVGETGVRWVLKPTVYWNVSVASGSAVALTTDTTATVATLSLPPGKYEVTGAVVVKVTSGTPTVKHASQAAHDVAATLPAQGIYSTTPINADLATTDEPCSTSVPPRVFDFSAAVGSTSVYLVARASFTGSGVGMAAFGSMRAKLVP